MRLAEGHQRNHWQHTSAVMAIIANASFKGGPYKPSDFDPFVVKKPPPKVSMRFLFEAHAAQRAALAGSAIPKPNNENR